jgi:lyso-ornithine lipid O-acyltransferase
MSVRSPVPAPASEVVGARHVRPPYGSRLGAALRLAGFLGLILLLVPVQAVHAKIGKDRPFLIAQFFHRMLLKVLGFRVRMHGTIRTPPPVLFVSNHASYLDIPVLGALLPTAFVAKAEVAGWPLFGLLAKLQHTVFIERRSMRADDHRDRLNDHLSMGQNLVLFPEGTSSDGLSVLPFKSSLFGAAAMLANGHPIAVQPVSVVCTEIGGLPLLRELRPFYAWYGDMTLVPHLWDVFAFGRFTVDVVFHAPVFAADFPDRKALAAYCQREVARGIERCLTGRERLEVGG